MKPNVIVFSGYGINCEEETKFAFEMAGAKVDIVHMNDLIANKSQLKKYQIIAIPGGFAYGDDTGAGNAYAQKLKNHLWEEMVTFINGGKLIIGICNGFQILVNLGFLPAINLEYGNRELGLMPNKIPRYTVRFVDLVVEKNNSPWLSDITTLSIPVSNGEGRLYATKEILQTMKKNQQVVLRYFKGDMCHYLNLPASPNGSIDNIAGIVDGTGRILGLMPHPERAMFFTQLPNWQLLKEQYIRLGKKLPTVGPGLQLFKNGVNYMKKL